MSDAPSVSRKGSRDIRRLVTKSLGNIVKKLKMCKISGINPKNRTKKSKNCDENSFKICPLARQGVDSLFHRRHSRKQLMAIGSV